MSMSNVIALRGAGVATIVLSALALSACPKQNGDDGTAKAVTTPEETQNSAEPQWVLRQETQPKVAVVFVHGLFGDTIGTWTNPNGKRFFDLVAADPAIAGKVDILAFGYPSHMFAAGSFDIQAAAKALHARLEHHGILSYSKVVFVGHSMGGLIIMRELLMNRAVMPAVPVIALLATPQEGAAIARIADYIARKPALSQLKSADENDLLKILNDDWHAWPDRPKVRCAYENMKTRGVVMVVKWSSSTRFCDASVEVAADHLGIVKPDGPESLAVIAVTNALKEYVFNPALDPRLETPDFLTEGDNSVFVLTQVNSKLPAQLLNSGGSALQFSLVEPSDRQALLLWPDRPQILPAKGKDYMHVLLMSAATQAEYRFKLRTDYGLDRFVIVRVPNLDALRAQQAQLMQGAAAAVLQRLDDDESTARWLLAPAEDGEIPEAVVRIVKEHIARERPDWPEGPQWIMTAEALNGLNWPGLAARALRQAERVAPEMVKQGSVQHIAAVTAAQSGDSKIFANLETPTLTDPVVSVSRANWLAQDSELLDASRLAEKLQTVPALQFYGLSLQGDVKKARGDTEGARAAYQGAAVIRPAPSITRRLEIAGGWRTTISDAPGTEAATRPADATSQVAESTAGRARPMSEVVVMRPTAVLPETTAVRPRILDPRAIVVQPAPEGQ